VAFEENFMRWRRGALALALAQIGLGLCAPVAVAAPPDAVVTAPADEGPAARARATGHRVELPELTTPTEQTFVNPEGTRTVEMHAVPTRGRKDGKWAPIDTSLRFKGSRVVPAAAAVDTAFSAGGSGPLVRLSQGDRALELTWPKPLPRPELAKDVARYRDVLPGVDLELRAVPQGFAKTFVVKDRAAAANPDLAALSFGIKATGVSVGRAADGSIVAADQSGQPVFRAGQARMWDSGAPRKEAQLPVELAAERITVVPDHAMLTAPDTAFPVRIDPDWSRGRAAWALVYGTPGNLSGQAYWMGDGDNIAKVGYTNRGDGRNPTVLVRSYFQFDTSSLIGKHILSAEFNAYEFFSPSCTPKPVGLHETGAITPSTTWNNQPWIGQQLAVPNVAHGYSPNCPPAWVGFGATGAVANAAGVGAATTTLMLKAVDEGTGGSDSWKKFDPNNVALNVTYNSIPPAPLNKKTDGKGCGLVPDQPYISKTGPALTIIPTDPDGGDVKVQFEWYVKGGAKKGGTTTLLHSAGSTFNTTIPAGTFPDGTTLSWRARTSDQVDWSPWSNYCDATVDTTRPGNPPLVSSPDFPRDGVGGGVGTTGRFYFEPGAATDVVAYKYDLHDQPSRTIAAGPDGKATALVTPPADTYYDLYVRSVDRAGNLSDLSVPYHFRPGVGTPPVGLWHLDGRVGDVDAFDSSANADNGTVKSGSRWTLGRHDDALLFDGTGYVSTPRSAVRTDSTFTVSAWVRPDQLESVWRTAVSQDGTNVSGFFLQLNPTTHKWRFMMPSTAGADSSRTAVESDVAAVAGRWTHLVGVFDKATGKLSMYVDGLPQKDSAVQATPWHASGGVQIGRGWYAGKYVDQFKGAVDEVRIYDRLLSVEEVRALATAPTVQEGFWQLDGAGRDYSGNDRQADVSGGVTWTSIAAVGTGSAEFDGVSGVLDTHQPAVRTDSSFTASAYVRLTGETGDWQAAVSQDGPHSSGFSLRYRSDTRKWSFGVSEADADDPVVWRADSPEVATMGEWTLLTGVYDETKHQLRLYVNSALVAVEPIAPDKHFTNVPGELVIGRAKLAGKVDRFFKGDIDHVAVYTGVRTDAQIQDDSRTPPLPASSIYSGQFTRWDVNSLTAQRTTNLGDQQRGARFGRSLGLPAPADAPDTAMLYSCRTAADEFMSTDPNCEGARSMGELGPVYKAPPEGIPTVPIYKCKGGTLGERFESPEAGCEGATNTGTLGYAQAFTYLSRYRETEGLGERRSSARAVPAKYRPDLSLGIISLTQQPGTVALMACRSGTDSFLSLQADCEGKDVLETTGWIWPSAPEGQESQQLLRCRTASSGELFETVDPTCEGEVLDKPLGFVRTVPA
jgi:hypothetical protein